MFEVMVREEIEKETKEIQSRQENPGIDRYACSICGDLVPTEGLKGRRLCKDKDCTTYRTLKYKDAKPSRERTKKMHALHTKGLTYEEICEAGLGGTPGNVKKFITYYTKSVENREGVYARIGDKREKNGLTRDVPGKV